VLIKVGLVAWQGGPWTRPPTARRFEEVDSVRWEIVPVSMMKLALSADHAIANGRDGALCMTEVKRVLENSVMLTV
jgi:pyruvate/2-oxoglutarate dehydrogenase complex dihydrolipoamide acyltransferase (E2) component